MHSKHTANQHDWFVFKFTIWCNTVSRLHKLFQHLQNTGFTAGRYQWLLTHPSTASSQTTILFPAVAENYKLWSIECVLVTYFQTNLCWLSPSPICHIVEFGENLTKMERGSVLMVSNFFTTFCIRMKWLTGLPTYLPICTHFAHLLIAHGNVFSGSGFGGRPGGRR